MSVKKKKLFQKHNYFLFGIIWTNPTGTIKLRKSNKYDDFYVMMKIPSARTVKCLILPVPPRDRNVPECEEEFTPPNTVTP